MIRRAAPGDEAGLQTFLGHYPTTSMFLRGNLSAHGLGESDSPNATTYHVWPAEGPIRAVLGLTRGGMVLCQLGDATEALAKLATALDGAEVSGISGEATQTKALIGALGLEDALFRMNDVEPLFHLDLARLPPGSDSIRPASAKDLPLLAQWLRTYLIETGIGLDGPTVEDRAARSISSGNLRFLIQNARPVAMAAINARAEGWVQVGGVFVPPEARNRGLGRRVTRALLAEAREAGATDAVLFSNNDAASRAYRSIGFVRVGEYRIFLLAAPRAAGIRP